MGDNGSLVLGYLIAFFSIKLLNSNGIGQIVSTEILLKTIVAVTFIPVFDALRVFAGRMLKKKSPFNPDKTHLHHLFLQKGFSHATTSIIIYLMHSVLISIALFSKSTGFEWTVIINTLIMTVCTALLMIQWSDVLLRIKQKKTSFKGSENHGV
jgi:UDP-N-acetylmuramyl pentapeptide phosphotransferase/UDP-N-acetylglucosamine-1-phosphate transferase